MISITSLFDSQIAGNHLKTPHQRNDLQLFECILSTGINEEKSPVGIVEWEKKQRCSHLCETCETYYVFPARPCVNM